MPTPVSTARQCLTPESATTLDDAVSVSRRRNHSQTTSLHALSALLSMPSSTLRDSLTRAITPPLNSPRLQFRAFELNLSVSLDRLPTLPTNKTLEHPPVSNSLMAAIKRAQANQRRHPETFHLYNNSSSPSINAVKVELKHFILSILDDPIVSRVFAEAGFRSSDVKIAVMSGRRVFGVSSRRGFSFPFSECLVSDQGSSDVDENSRRIGEVLMRKNGKNLLLVGNCAVEGLKCFVECLEKRKGRVFYSGGPATATDRGKGEVFDNGGSTTATDKVGVFDNGGPTTATDRGESGVFDNGGPVAVTDRGKGGVLGDEISGLRFVSIEKEVLEFVGKGGSEGSDEVMKRKLKEVVDKVENGELLVNYGDVRVLVESGLGECVKFVVCELSRLVEVYGRRLRLIGVSASDYMYRMFVDRFPGVEKDWDLELMPITSSRSFSMGGGYPKSSLLGSFVPFGGFFSLPSELENIRSKKVPFTGRCSICNENYEREVSAALKEMPDSSSTGNSMSNIPSWLQCGSSKSSSFQEAKDGNIVSAARFVGLQKKWNDICQHLHFSSSSEMSGANSQVPDLQNVEKQNVAKSHSLEAGSFPCAENVVQSTKNRFELRDIHNHNITCSVGNVSQPLDCMVGQSRISVTTKLQLGALYASKDKGLKEVPSQERRHLSGSVSSERTSIDPRHLPQSVSSSIPHLGEKYDSDFKQLYRALSHKVYWQEEAIYLISQTISRCRSGHGKPFSSGKGNVWLSFLGPDKVAKRKTAVALSEKLYGSRANLISVDLNSKGGSTSSSSLFLANNLVLSDVKSRGMMIVDYIIEELKGKPNSIVLLEDIDNADILLQNSLLQALKTGKFPNSHGREISISNKIFVMTSTASKAVQDLPSAFPEERVLAARDLQMRILVEDASTNNSDIRSSNIEIIGTKDMKIHVSKLKRILTDNTDFNMPKRMRNEEPTWSLDLNLPVQEMEEDNGDSETHSCYSDDITESSKAWLEEVFGLLDENVVFKPFNFDSLAEKILMDMRTRFQEIVGSSSFLEIEAEVIVQIIAAAWLSENKLSMVDWVEQVVCKSFLEAKQKWNLTDKTVMKLVTCEGLPVKDHAPGIHLPAKINVT